MTGVQLQKCFFVRNNVTHLLYGEDDGTVGVLSLPTPRRASKKINRMLLSVYNTILHPWLVQQRGDNDETFASLAACSAL